MPAETLRVYLPSDRIQARVREMGAQIAADYPDGDLVLVCILKGACFFLADLARAIPRDVRLDFMGISSYGAGKTTSGEVKVTKDLDRTVQDAHVIIVEDILDSGVTLTYLTQVLRQRHPASLAIATLLDKPARRMRPVEVKYSGFTIEDEFVVGYGLDYAERYRNLPDVCIVENA